ncbi:MAG: hypothetical protein PHI32_05365 [Dysgonamonadaceae bacterium]|nr:hypothetical protein [Dysgonamonadaceae bacterium]
MKLIFVTMTRIIILLSVILFFNCSNQLKNESDTTVFETKAKLEEEYKKKTEDYKKEVDSKIEEVDTRLGKLNTLIKEQNEGKAVLIFSIIILNAIVIIIVFIILYIFSKTEIFKNIIIEKVVKSQRVEDMVNKKLYQQKKSQSFNKFTTTEIKEIGDRVIKYIESLEIKKMDSENKGEQYKENIINPKIILQNTEQSSPPKYLKGKTGNRFNNTDSSPEGSFFKIIDEKEETAHFVFNGVEEEAIAKRVFSDDISKIISGSYDNWKFVRTVTPGEIKHVGDHWEVTKPIEVKFN